MSTFDGRTATEAEIVDRAAAMPGRSFAELATVPGLSEASSPHTKGRVGVAAEAYFGMEADGLPEPDFRSAGIELKTVPLRPRNDEVLVKERAFISMIDYHRLVDEDWATASVRRKLSRILFVYYDWRPRAPLGELVVSDVVLWSPTPELMTAFGQDWRAVRDLVRAGRASEISESHGSVLVAATKGPGGPPSRTQPYSSELARQRAWALKPAFLRALLEDHRSGSKWVYEVATTLESRVVAVMRRFAGRRLADVEQELGMPSSRSKHRASLVFRRAVSMWAGTSHRELLDAGIDLRVVQTDGSLMPYESLSFPAFRYQELIREDWESSELMSRLDRFIYVPIVGGKGLESAGDCVIQPAFSWVPPQADLDVMEQEWTEFRDEIRAGKALELTPASRTRVLHVRPKGKDGLDTDPAPGVGPVVKKCFWFNRSYVAEVLRSGVPSGRNV